jgi:hypothetical protein
MKSKFYVMCKFIWDEPFFMKLDMTYVYRRACKILVQRWEKNPNTFYCETYVVSQTKLTTTSPLYVQNIIVLLK